MIEMERIDSLNDSQTLKGRYVLCWMQQAQRADYNHALEFAIERANELKKPLVVFFGITPNFPRANANHYRFMLEGLRETREAVLDRGASFVVQAISPEKGAVALAEGACEAVCDMGYLRIQRRWREYVARNVDCPLHQVESDVVVPVRRAMGKAAYSAAVLRPKIQRELGRYLKPVRKPKLFAHEKAHEAPGLAPAAARHIDKAAPPLHAELF